MITATTNLTISPFSELICCIAAIMAPDSGFSFSGGMTMSRILGLNEFRSSDERKKAMKFFSAKEGRAKARASKLSDPERLRSRAIKKKLNDSIRRNMNRSLIKKKGGVPWSKLVGYTVDELIIHLQDQFENGMDWGNHSRHGWHIDHIVPINMFTYETPSDFSFQQCWAIINLRPMWHGPHYNRDKVIEKKLICNLPIYRTAMDCENTFCEDCCFCQNERRVK